MVEGRETLQDPLGAGDALHARVDAGGLIEGAGEGFEDALGHMVGIAAGEDIDVEVHAAVDGEGAEKFLDELELEGPADRGDAGRGVVGEVGSTAEVDDCSHEGFIHRDIGQAVALDACFGAEGLCEGLPEGDSDILNRVVVIDFDIALGGEVEIEESVFCEEGEHVIEKSDAGGDAGNAGAIDKQGELDRCLGGFALKGCVAGHAGD